MNYTQKMGKRLATLILCLCTLLALFPTTALADGSLIAIKKERTTSLDVNHTSCNNDHYWRFYNWSLTEQDGTSAAKSTKTYSGTMTIDATQTNITRYVVSYDSSSGQKISSVTFANGSATASSTQATSITWTFTNAKLSELETLISYSWIYIDDNTINQGGDEGNGSLSIGFGSDLTEKSKYTVALKNVDDDITGTVKATDSNATTITTAGVQMEECDSITFTITPPDGYYVSAYYIYETDTSTVKVSKEGQTATGDVTTEAVALDKNITIEPWYEKTPETKRDEGSLSWANTVEEGTNLSYKDALDFNYNPIVTAKLLDSSFGTSATQGSGSLANPTMYMKAQFADNDAIIIEGETTGSMKDLGKIVGQNTPKEKTELPTKITASSVKPGTFTQSILADYTTAGSTCPNHWYHVGNLTYHEDKIERTFTILQDTLTLGVTDKNDSGAATQTSSPTYTYSTDLDITPVLTPDSYSATNGKSSQAVQPDVDDDKDKLITVTVEDSEGNVVTDLQNGYTPKKAGTYTYTVTYDGGDDDYIASYTADGTSQTEDALNTYNALRITVTIKKGTNPADPKLPTITESTTELTLSDIVDDQDYSIDGGTTWISGKDLKEKYNSKFSGLEQGTKYTVSTRLRETDQYNAEISTQSVATLVTVSGTVTQTESENGGATPALPAVVTFTSTTDPTKTYTVTTDKDGNYSIDLPIGNTYTVSATDKNGWQSGTGANLAVKENDKDLTEGTIEMTNTDKGNAKLFADANLTDGDGNLMDSLDDLDTADADTLQKIVDSEVAYGKLAAGVQTALDNDILGSTTYKKLLAMAKLQQKIAAKKAEIDQAVKDGTLSESDAEALKALIDKAAKEAKDGLNTAENTDEAIQKVVSQFNTDMALIDKKIDATKKINTTVQAAKDKIDALSSLTAAHKQALKDAIDAAAKTAKDTVNKAATQTEIDDALKTLNTNLDDINDQAVARNFADKYLADGNGNIYTDFDSSSIDKILDAYNAYNALTDKQKALVDAMISKATGGKYTTYAEYRAAAQEAAGSGANKFIENHMTLNGNTVTSVSRDTYDNILGGAADWSKLSQTEKDIVNARLKAAGATQTYEEMLAAAQEAVDKSADDFISKYLGNIYTEATFGNYRQILSGLADWKAMSQSERDAVNAKLMAAIGKTYEMLLAEAQELAEIMAILSVPDTGDDTNFTLLYALLLVGAVGLTGTYACGKRKKYNK